MSKSSLMCCLTLMCKRSLGLVQTKTYTQRKRRFEQLNRAHEKRRPINMWLGYKNSFLKQKSWKQPQTTCIEHLTTKCNIALFRAVLRYEQQIHLQKKRIFFSRGLKTAFCTSPHPLIPPFEIVGENFLAWIVVTLLIQTR